MPHETPCSLREKLYALDRERPMTELGQQAWLRKRTLLLRQLADMEGWTMDTKRLLLTWDAFDEAVQAATAEFKNSAWVTDGNCSGIYGIPRGGLILAVALSHHLELPLLLQPQKRCIIVDDVIETGVTFHNLLDHCNKEMGISDNDLAAWCWISKNPELGKAGHHKYVDPDVWVVLPWEDWAKAADDMRKYYERRTA